MDGEDKVEKTGVKIEFIREFLGENRLF